MIIGGTKIEDIATWQTLAPKAQIEDSKKVELKNLRFHVNESINNQIRVWFGDIKSLVVDAIVNSTNESMNDPNGLSGQILDMAGPELQNEISKMEPCRTGESRITNGYNLYAKHIIHTVGPRYNEKYKTAAENALHSCYKSSLTLLKEKNLLSIAFPVINSQKRGFPPENGAHVAIRTVRRFLEHFGNGVDCVIFCFANQVDMTRYNKILPLYFPRTYDEEVLSKEELPRDIGNDFGETVIEERKIKISAFPTPIIGNTAQKSDPSSPVKNNLTKPSYPAPSNPQLNPLSKVETVQQFGAMKYDINEEKKKRLQNLSKAELLIIEQQQTYQRWIAQAKKMDLSDIARLGIIYESGKDIYGRPVIVISGSKIPDTSTLVMDKIFMFALKLMDGIVNKEYVVVYLHTFMDDKEKPEYSWFQKVYSVMDSRFGKNLKAFYIIHPTFWLKIAESFFATFSASDNTFWSKVKYIDQLRDIYNYISNDQIIIPENIYEYDFAENGHYYNTNIRNSENRNEDL